MSIQGLGQSFAAYPPMRMGGMQGENNDFDPSSVDSIMEKDDADADGILTIDETPMPEYPRGVRLSLLSLSLRFGLICFHCLITTNKKSLTPSARQP